MAEETRWCNNHDFRLLQMKEIYVMLLTFQHVCAVNKCSCTANMKIYLLVPCVFSTEDYNQAYKNLKPCHFKQVPAVTREANGNRQK